MLLLNILASISYLLSKDSFLTRQGSQSISWTTVRDNSWRTWHRAFFGGGSSKLFKWMAHSSVRGDNISLKYVKHMGHFKNNFSSLLKWRVTSLCKRIYLDVQIILCPQIFIHFLNELYLYNVSSILLKNYQVHVCHFLSIINYGT